MRRRLSLVGEHCGHVADHDRPGAADGCICFSSCVRTAWCRRAADASLLVCHRPQQMHTRVALSSVARAGSCDPDTACDVLEAIRPCIDLTESDGHTGNVYRRRDLIDRVLVFIFPCYVKLMIFMWLHILQQLRANGLAPQSCRRLLACQRPQQMHTVVI